jgi:murein DD-endopeptidase MepM/ murein hydrolase activator NlpD
LGVSVLKRVCVAVTVALPLACATISVRHDPPPPVAPPRPTAPAALGAHTVLDAARVAAAFDVPLAPALVDRMVRWQREVRDLARGVRERFAALTDAITVPDVSVLVLEPVARTRSSGFGWRDDPIRHTRSFHSGTDFRGKRGTPVLAAGDGVIRFSGRRGGYGNMVDIDHGGGVVTRYAHLRRIAATRDAAVMAGQRIGELGSTGRTTGPHLHFEVRIDGSPVSPIAAMAIAALQRESPLAGRLAALSLSPGLQALAESDVDPPRQRAKQAQRPERAGRAGRRQVLW